MLLLLLLQRRRVHIHLRRRLAGLVCMTGAIGGSMRLLRQLLVAPIQAHSGMGQLCCILLSRIQRLLWADFLTWSQHSRILKWQVIVLRDLMLVRMLLMTLLLQSIDLLLVDSGHQVCEAFALLRSALCHIGLLHLHLLLVLLTLKCRRILLLLEVG